MNIKKVLSFLYPIKVLKKHNAWHTLELEWYNGKLMLNSSEANYSFGNLQEVFKMAFKDSHLAVAKDARVLLLGLGGGCVINLLEDDYGFCGYVKAIEIDQDVISMYHNYFEKDRKAIVDIMPCDALKPDEYLTSDEQFDLILCDVFLDLKMPSTLFDKSFYSVLKKHLSPNGLIYLNSIPANEKAEQGDLMEVLWSTFKEVRKFNYFEMNEVYCVK
jgi:spermidine synthase